jgi:hypothetical protein
MQHLIADKLQAKGSAEAQNIKYSNIKQRCTEQLKYHKSDL